MHELSLARELVTIIEQVAADHRAGCVSSARLEIGEMTCVNPDALSFAFDVASRGTVAEGCTLEIQRIELSIACPGCHHRGQVPLDALCCPACGHAPVQVTGGREIRLVSIEVDGQARA